MSFHLFLALTLITGLVAVAAILYAYRKTRDSFHPIIYLGLMLLFLYCYFPLNLFLADSRGLTTFLSIEQLEYVQGLNLLGVISLCAGVLWGGRFRKHTAMTAPNWMLPPIVNKRLKRAAIVCGLIGVLGFAYGIVNVGGLEAAYGRAYGGGWDESGYVRESVLLTLPALLWFMVSHIQRKLSKVDWIWIVLFTAPFLVHGLLGARRGPTAMILIALAVSWYLMRFRRPNLPTVVAGSLVLGVLLLFLVSNRGNIYLGSDLNLENTPTTYLEAGTGNEFIYGAGSILNADIQQDYFWGRRYFTIFFIRPIPRAIWPSKYEDAGNWLGIPNLELNLGTGGDEITESLGWAGAVGAAPGIVADMWIEFCWGAFPVLFAIGWSYGMAWRKAIGKGGLWIPLYTLMTALSVYLVMQTLEAMAFRFLLTAAAAGLIWRYGLGGLSKQIPPYASRTMPAPLHSHLRR